MTTAALAWESPPQVVRLSPQMRAVPQQQAMAPLPMETIQAFLREHRVVEPGAPIRELAYVVGGENQRLMSGAGDTLYARGVLPPRARLGIYRPGERYVSAEGTPLGTELINIGEARQLSREGEIARLEVLSAYQEVRNNDILLPLDAPLFASQSSENSFQPRLPLNDVAGQIIAVPGGVRFIGRLQIVALDIGTQEGLQPGHVLHVGQQGELVNDPRSQELLQLPATEAGRVMVVKPYSLMSYALVMQASNVLAVGDRVHTPIR